MKKADSEKKRPYNRRVGPFEAEYILSMLNSRKDEISKKLNNAQYKNYSLAFKSELSVVDGLIGHFNNKVK